MKSSQITTTLHAMVVFALLANEATFGTSAETFVHSTCSNDITRQIAGFASYGRKTGALSKRKKQIVSAINVSTRAATPLHIALRMTDDEEDEANYYSPMRQRPQPKGGDMAYTSENILRQLRHYQNIRKVGGSECVQDLYVRDPNTSGQETRFWFVGKVARCTGTVSAEAAIARQFNLIEEHACRIRPVELGRSFGKLDFFVAPGDSEPLTSQNDPVVMLRKIPRDVDGLEKVTLLEVGLNLEIVTNRGAGFGIIRTEDGIVPPDLIGH